MIQICCGEIVRIDPKQYIKVDKFIKPFSTQINDISCHTLFDKHLRKDPIFTQHAFIPQDNFCMETTTKYSKQCQICDDDKMNLSHRYQCTKCRKMIKLCNTCSVNYDIHQNLTTKIDEQNRKIDNLTTIINELVRKSENTV